VKTCRNAVYEVKWEIPVKKILRAFERLRNVGVAFGISVTATSKNVDVLLSDEFYDFFFKEQGASYMWQFQIYELYENGKTLADAMFSDFMKEGRKWQREYGLDNCKKPDNWLMPCSIRDHYEIFRTSILPEYAKPEDQNAKEALESTEYFEVLKDYDEKLQGLTEKIWENEYLNV